MKTWLSEGGGGPGVPETGRGGIRVVDRPVIDAVRTYLRALELHGLPVSLGVIFGSQVIGVRDRWSDIDVLVVSPRFDGERNRRDVDLLWHLAARTDSRIEPIPCGVRQWEEDDTNPIIEIARRDGESIAAGEAA